MANPPIDPALHARVQELVKKMSHSQVQKALKKEGIKISIGEISKCRNTAALTPPVKANKKSGTLSWREMIPAMQTMQGLKKKASSSQDTAVIELGDGSAPVALAAFSDQHMGAWSTDYSELIRLTDEFVNTPNLYMGLVGDYAHYAIKLRNVLEVSDNLLPPEQQTQFLENWFEEIWPKVAFATWDNHGVERQEQMSGESSVKRILSKRVCYFNGIGHVDIKVGEQVYKGAVSHMFRGRSMMNPIHGQQRYLRYEGHDREWAMAGDSHVPGMGIWTDGSLTRAAVNAGSLQVNSGYGKRYFSLTTHPVYPILVFRNDRHAIQVFWSVRDWLEAKGEI